MNENRFPENLPPAWREKLRAESQKPYFADLARFLKTQYRAGKKIFPPQDVILRALQCVDLPDVRVVILGQDPYHGPGQALGLCFAVPNSLRPKPPSLLNIFKEIESDLGVKVNPGASDLSGWAAQGVLLLNTVLTVEAHTPLSHRDKGWEHFTDEVIRVLNAREKPMIFILWGSHAQKKKAMIDLNKHFVLESAHPSPLSAHRGFLGSKVFSRANQILVEKLGQPAIAWDRLSDGPVH